MRQKTPFAQRATGSFMDGLMFLVGLTLIGFAYMLVLMFQKY